MGHNCFYQAMETYSANMSPRGTVLGSSETKCAINDGKRLSHSMSALFLMAPFIICILGVAWAMWNACECMATVYAAGLTDVSNLRAYMGQHKLGYALAFMAIIIELILFGSGLAWKSRILACFFLYLSPCTSFKLAYFQLVVLMILYKTVNYSRKSNRMKCFVITVIIITLCTPMLLYINSASETGESGITLTVDATTDGTQHVVDALQVVSSVTAVTCSDLVSLFGVDKSVTLHVISDPFIAFYTLSVRSVLRVDEAAWKEATTQAFTVKATVDKSKQRFQMQGKTLMDVVRNFANWVNPKSDVPQLGPPNHITATVINGISSLDGFSDDIKGECKIEYN